ncbi:MAG: Crp/Fnr family transcriptional regulator [Roseivirga sp.]|nr:Crp/Fnr family transcriptional regulator [Roseivirga sp.]
MQALLSYMKYYVTLTPEEEEAVLETYKVKTFPKGHILIHEGQVCQHMYFILKGVCRTYHDHTKKEVTTWIYPEDNFLTSWSSFIQETPGSESLQVLEKDTELAFITKESLQQLYDRFRSIERFGRCLAEEQLALIDDYSRGYALLSAREKYESLLSFFPDVTQRVNLGYVASVLGITQETLSRIRRKD